MNRAAFGQPFFVLRPPVKIPFDVNEPMIDAIKIAFTCSTLIVLMAGASPTWAADRPYLATNSAAAEEDDDQVWSVESTWQKLGSARALSVAPEYAFNPTTSLQFEFTHARDRGLGESGQALGVEFKHLFNHIARDGYGWGLSAELEFERAGGQGWKRSALALKLPVTLNLGEGMALLHLNAGLLKPTQGAREWTRSVALEGEIYKRTTLFAELARQGEEKLAHLGVRHWLRKDRLALDLAVQRAGVDGARETGLVIGLGLYDISF